MSDVYLLFIINVNKTFFFLCFHKQKINKNSRIHKASTSSVKIWKVYIYAVLKPINITDVSVFWCFFFLRFEKKKQTKKNFTFVTRYWNTAEMDTQFVQKPWKQRHTSVGLFVWHFFIATSQTRPVNSSSFNHWKTHLGLSLVSSAAYLKAKIHL